MPHWTKDLPAEAGHYWWMEEPDLGRKVVWVSSLGTVGELSKPGFVAAALGGYWYGPLEPPEMPDTPPRPPEGPRPVTGIEQRLREDYAEMVGHSNDIPRYTYFDRDYVGAALAELDTLRRRLGVFEGAVEVYRQEYLCGSSTEDGPPNEDRVEKAMRAALGGK